MTLSTLSRLAAFSVCAALFSNLALSHEPVDKTRLPVGDGKYSTSPKKGYVWTCSQIFRGGGAHASGAWMRGDGTYDFTAKPIVEGAVSWPSAFKFEVQGHQRIITSNNLPSHPTGVFPVDRNSEAYKYDRNPNSIRSKDFRLVLPKDPELADPSCLGMGAIGFLKTGGVFFNSLDAPGKDAVANEIQDACQGHPERDGSYHYHSLTTCLEPDKKTTQHSDLVGYALDGFGIFGRYGEGGKELTNADLDECHGHIHEVMWDGQLKAIYHYHATWEYPYTMGCLRGKPARIEGMR
jgi:YHYH protein